MPEQTANSSLIKDLPGTVIPLGIAVLDYSFKGANEIYVKFVHEEGDTSQSAEFKCSANPRDVTFSFATWMNGYHHAHLRKDTNVASSSGLLAIDAMTGLVKEHLADMDVKVRTDNVVPEELRTSFSAILPDGYAWHGGDGSVARGYIIACSDMGARWHNPRRLAEQAAQAAAVAAIERSR